MYNIDDFLTYLESITVYTYMLPTREIRENFPYVSVVPIVSNIDDIYQQVVHKNSIDNTNKNIQEFIDSRDLSQFSFTAIDTFDNDNALDIANGLQALFRKQIIKDWFQARSEAIRILSPVTPRFVIEDDFDEARFGFDIQITSRISTEQDKEFIDSLTISDSGDKIADIIL